MPKFRYAALCFSHNQNGSYLIMPLIQEIFAYSHHHHHLAKNKCDHDVIDHKSISKDNNFGLFEWKFC